MDVFHRFGVVQRFSSLVGKLGEKGPILELYIHKASSRRFGRVSCFSLEITGIASPRLNLRLD